MLVVKTPLPGQVLVYFALFDPGHPVVVVVVVLGPPLLDLVHGHLGHHHPHPLCPLLPPQPLHRVQARQT